MHMQGVHVRRSMLNHTRHGSGWEAQVVALAGKHRELRSTTQGHVLEPVTAWEGPDGNATEK